jgi:hypothetical protein
VRRLIVLALLASWVCALAGEGPLASAKAASDGCQLSCFDFGWRFHLGDTPGAEQAAWAAGLRQGTVEIASRTAL